VGRGSRLAKRRWEGDAEEMIPEEGGEYERAIADPGRKRVLERKEYRDSQQKEESATGVADILIPE